MDSVVSQIERRLEAYADPIEVAVLGCAVNGIGEASHADFGITGAKDEGLIFSRGKPLKKVPTPQLVDALFEEIDKYATSKRIDVDATAAAEAGALLDRLEDKEAMTPERMAALEKAKADGDEEDTELLSIISPVAGRRFTRA
jgi:(E)-4-hydroxy-3-methylbut-2-enyl-diphosphate synthase